MSLLTGNQPILVAARDISAERTAGKYWWLPEMSLLTGNQPVLVAARDISADRKPASTGGCQRYHC
jgi:sensor domain CHASE-containing protein